MRIGKYLIANVLLILLVLSMPAMVSAQRPILPRIRSKSLPRGHAQVRAVETNAIFDSARIAHAFDLADTTFSKGFYAAYALFGDAADFSGATFTGTVNFGSAKFQKSAMYNDATFLDSTLFDSAKFVGDARFTDVTFSKIARFSNVSFKGPVWFDDAAVLTTVYFYGARFSTYAKFTNLQLTDSTQLEFGNAVLPDTLDLSENGTLKKSIDLSTANFTDSSRYDEKTGGYRPHLLFLYKSDISKFNLDYFHFKLLVLDSTLSPTYRNKRPVISIDEQEAMYEALLNNFKLAGKDESYKRLDIEYQSFLLDHSWARWLKWVPAAWWNFGYDKEYIFYWIGGLILFFSLLNLFFIDILNTFVYKIDGIPEKVRSLGLRKTAWYSFVYTANIFFRLTLENKNIKFRKGAPTIYFLVIYILGILCLGYLANFILQK